MLTAWRRYGENALLGWDMGRCAYITQCCYLAGYINMKEMLDLCVDAGTKAQAFFRTGRNDGGAICWAASSGSMRIRMTQNP